MAELVIAATLAPLLAAALKEVADEVVVKPLLGPAAELFKSWVDGRVDDIKVRKAVETAASAVGQWEGLGDRYRLKSALHRLAEPGRVALHKSTVAAVLAMTDDAAEEVPVELLRALDVPEEYRTDLAHFLWAFRSGLVEDDEDRRVQAALEAIRGYLKSVASDVEILASTVVETPGGERAIRTIPASLAAREIEEAYLSALVERELCYLRLEGRHVQSPEAMLHIRLQNVYIALNIERPEAGGPESDLGEMDRALEKESISALRALLDHHCLLLLGKPGSGKTTFVEHLALCLAGERWQPGQGWAEHLQAHDAAWEAPALLPVRIRLRKFAADRTALPQDTNTLGRASHLLDYVKAYLSADPWHDHLPRHVVSLFQDGQALLVLDGLDEVGDPQRRRQVAEAINDLVDRVFPSLWVVVTCRVAQYHRDPSGRCTDEWALSPSFYCATLADFTPQQIELFADHWFGEVYCRPQDRRVQQEKAQTLKEAIASRSDLQEIAPRPILLTQMALVHDAARLPDTRVELYDKCAELLLWEWERIRAERAGRRETADQWIQKLEVPRLRRDHLQSTLDDAVFEVHEKQEGAVASPVEIPSSTLVAHLARRFVNAGLGEPQAESKARFFVSVFLRERNGLLVPAGEESFQTPHRTFQEFMAARSLARKDQFHWEARERVARNYDLWHEVFVLAVGLAGLVNRDTRRVVDAVDHLCPETFPKTDAAFRDLILAGAALAEVGVLTVRELEEGQETEQRVTRFLHRTMQDTDERGKPYKRPRVPIPTRYSAAETLDRLGWLPNDLDAFVEIPMPKAQSPIYIGRYPVTNYQFERFVKDGGYEERGRRWWSDEGWDWRKKGERRRSDRSTDQPPEYWDNPRFGRSRHGYPVVGVSWYEANAYCAWLTEQLRMANSKWRIWRDGRSEICNPPSEIVVRLPTEEEWIAAAGGEKGNRYPWGPQWDESHANTDESHIGGTTPVPMYPSGQSPAGVWDMGGNVWEWMGSEYMAGVPALRGGSWDSDHHPARVGGRFRYSPDFSHHYVGFRVLASPAGA